MSWTTSVKRIVNRVLSLVGLELQTTKESRSRLERLQRHYELIEECPVFPEPWASGPSDWATWCDRLTGLQADVRAMWEKAEVPTDNGYYMGLDAALLYSFTRSLKPQRFLEVGSGYSTRIARQAIIDGALGTKIMSIDPSPRADVHDYSDEIIRSRLEHHDWVSDVEKLRANDIFFLDSSHEVDTGNDVVEALLKIFPQLPSGVVIHIHDIFLPYDYPSDWVLGDGLVWAEQYLVQGLLCDSSRYEVLFPGYKVFRDCADLLANFPQEFIGRPQSLWLRVRETS